MNNTAPVALLHASSYSEDKINHKIGELLDKCGLKPGYGAHVLVKPNLLMARDLACANPIVTSAVCKWLLDNGCHVLVGDSPAFGTAQNVAKAIGLTETLKKIGLAISPFNKVRKVRLKVAGKEIKTGIAALALESDLLFSVARVKAHSQMRMTLCVKNCFGVVPGMRKACLHAIYGTDRNFFANMLAAIWKLLPPVAAVADGVVAMHKTGPSNGSPFQLGLLGACQNAALLDQAVLEILHVDQSTVPLAVYLSENPLPTVWPLLSPADFSIHGFIVPENLKSASFNPVQLVRSCLKRMWKNLQG